MIQKKHPKMWKRNTFKGKSTHPMAVKTAAWREKRKEEQRSNAAYANQLPYSNATTNRAAEIAQLYSIYWHQGREEHVLQHRTRGILVSNTDRALVVTEYQQLLSQDIKKLKLQIEKDEAKEERGQ